MTGSSDTQTTRRNVDLSYWRYFFIAEEDRNAMDRWMLGGKCYRTGLQELFVPEPSLGDPEKSTRAETDTAKKICNGQDGTGVVCPVREKCGDYAIENGIWEGVWGGMSQRERRKVSRQRKLDAVARETPVKLQSPKGGRSGKQSRTR